ncbi:MAG: hypothetical protein ACFFDF_08110 [Candidatus Odinarchaeota archaeon]
MSICSNRYPYTCSGDNKLYDVCGHLGKDHIFRNGKSICYKCVMDPYAKKKRISGLKKKEV